MFEQRESPNLEVEIIEQLATLSSNGNWHKEFNIVQWGDNIAKYDIRSWNKNHSKAGKGITFTLEEIKILKKALDLMDI